MLSRGITCLFVSWLCASALAADIHSEAVRLIVSHELEGIAAPEGSSFCLAVESGGSIRDATASQLESLKKAGMKGEKASACYKALQGYVISIKSVHRDGAVLTAQVETVDARIEEGSHFATMLRRGRYELAESPVAGWTIRSYSTGMSSPAGVVR